MSRPPSDLAPRYHAAMVEIMRERGYSHLAESHLLALRDDPWGCECRACRRSRIERRALREE